MIALRHQKTRALAIVPEEKEQMFLEAGYIPVKGQENPVPSENKSKKSRSRKKKVAENATDADGSM
jgi:hypothetical protein